MYIKNLNYTNAVVLGENKYLIQLRNYETYDIDGNPYHTTADEQRVVTSIDNIYVVKPNKPVLDHFIDSTGNKVPVDEYDKLMSELSKLPKTSNGYVYPDLQTEFHYRSRLEVFESMEQVKIVPPAIKTKIDYEIIGSMEDTGSKFIETSFILGEATFFGKGPYKFLGSFAAVDEFRKVTADNPKFVMNSDLQWAKYDSVTIFSNRNNRFITSRSDYAIFPTLEQAQEEERKVRQFVREVCESYDKPIVLDADGIDKNKIIDKLYAIKKRVTEIQSKNATMALYTNSVKDINNLIEELIAIK